MPSLKIDPSDRLFILTGAGISAESGIQTFRDAGGLWEGHDVVAVASPEGFKKDPQLVWRFYSERRQHVLECNPNAAHDALAVLEQQLTSKPILFTQNVDNLHQRAGSSVLSAMHGNLFKSRCEKCAIPFDDEQLYFDALPQSCINCGGAIRPDIVWFGEEPRDLNIINAVLRCSNVMLVVGTSGRVYPAADFIRKVGKQTRTIYVGLERPANAAYFDELHLGKAGEILPELLAF